MQSFAFYLSIYLKYEITNVHFMQICLDVYVGVCYCLKIKISYY